MLYPPTPPIPVGEEPHSSTWTPEGTIASNDDNFADYYIDGGGFSVNGTQVTAPDGTCDSNRRFGGRLFPTDS